MSKIIGTLLTVDAPVQAVWAPGTDLAAYHAWNPFIVAASGTIRVGDRLEMTVRPPGVRSRSFKPWVTAVEPHRYIEWLGPLGLPGILDSRQSFTLTAKAGSTLFQQSATISGLLTPFTGSFRACVSRWRVSSFHGMRRASHGHVARRAADHRRQPDRPRITTPELAGVNARFDLGGAGEREVG